MSATEDQPTEQLETGPLRKGRRLWPRVLAVTALVVAGLGGTAFAWNSHVQGELDRRDEAISLLRIESDEDRRDSQAAHKRAVARLEANHEVELESAVAAEKRRGVRALRRAVRKQKARARREAKEARDAGYASGSVEGYTTGHSIGEDAGLLKGSDGLDCSDDIDVYWLPPCY